MMRYPASLHAINAIRWACNAIRWAWVSDERGEYFSPDAPRAEQPLKRKKSTEVNAGYERKAAASAVN